MVTLQVYPNNYNKFTLDLVLTGDALGTSYVACCGGSKKDLTLGANRVLIRTTDDPAIVTNKLLKCIEEADHISIWAGGRDGYNKFVYRAAKAANKKNMAVYYRRSRVFKASRIEKLLGGAE